MNHSLVSWKWLADSTKRSGSTASSSKRRTSAQISLLLLGTEHARPQRLKEDKDKPKVEGFEDILRSKLISSSIYFYPYCVFNMIYTGILYYKPGWV